MDDLIRPLIVLLSLQTSRVRTAYDARRGPREGEAGVSTLEMVIIALGLMAVAGLLVAAVTVAVSRRTEQIK
jgi:hypothetical protein